jgi:hypothetical protein
MPHISKKKLDDKEVEALFLQVVYVLDRAASRGKLEAVLKQLLTSTEKVMFAKRLAAVSLLSEDLPIFDIAENLLMSPSTVDLMSLRYETGAYSALIKDGLRKKDISDILRLIETVGGTMPPRGKGRWRNFNEAMRKAHAEARLKKLAQKRKKAAQTKIDKNSRKNIRYIV